MPTPFESSPTLTTAPTGIPYIDALTARDGLLTGLRWEPLTLSFSFPGASATWMPNYSTPAAGHAAMTAQQQQAVRTQLQAWDSLCGLEFVEVADTATSVGDLRFALSNELPNRGWAAGPDGRFASGGDVWMNADHYRPGVSMIGDTVLLHEIGHALGLHHPLIELAPELGVREQRAYTVMSEWGDYYVAQGGGYVSVHPTTPMLFDVAAIQSLYGADWTTRSGNDTYRYRTDQVHFETIWDGGGSDTIAAVGSRAASIDLRAGNASQIGTPVLDGVAGKAFASLWIAYGCVIENAAGGSGSDKLTGNAAANRLEGGAGSDRIAALAGNDRLAGGTGNDRLEGGAGADRFLFASKLDAKHNVDRIVDFGRGDDRLLLDRDIFGALGSKVTGGELRLGRSARDSNDHLIHEPASGRLYYDADGKGGDAAVLFATLEPGTVLGAGDFLMG